MELPEILTRLSSLHRDVSQLMRETLHTKPTLVLALQRRALRHLEDRFDEHVSAFITLDEEFHSASPPSTFNGVANNMATFSLRRDSVRGLLIDTSGALGSLRNQLDFRRTMVVAVVALVVSVVTLFK